MKATPIIAGLTLTLIAAGHAVFAQTGAQPSATGNVLYRGAPLGDEQARFTQCMKDWDTKTHMTKQEWERTCRRVTDERIKYLRQQGYLPDGKNSQAGAK